jgi:CRP-like cAMP-binding protein
MDLVGELEQNSALFADFASDEVQALVSAGAVQQVATGATICREGDTEDSLYVIVTGKAKVSRQVRGEALPLASLGPGEVFGEMAILTGQPRAADLAAAADSDILELSRSALETAFTVSPRVAGKFWHNVAAILAGRLAKTNKMAEEYFNISQRLVEDPDFYRFYSQL